MLDALASLIIGLVIFTICGRIYSLIVSPNSRGYFHGIGRRVIAVVTLGRIRIPSALRQPKRRGARPKPSRNDFIALVTGVVTFLAAMSIVIWGLST